MKELEDIIQSDNENTNLDFKAIQYKADKHENFLKDLISMANAKTNEDKLIIIGVNHKTNGERDIIGVNDNFVDDSYYQQLANENVEPEIEFKYYPYEFDSKKFGIFVIRSCNNPPYMLKKDFKTLKKGDCFIRKGSHQTRVTRSDIDYYFSQKLLNGKFKGTISLNFNDSNSKILTINRNKNLQLPSENAAIRIREILKEKEEKLEKLDNFGIMLMNRDIPMLGRNSYENRSISTLKENLESVKETYSKDDLFYLFEENSIKINLTLVNNGSEYLEDSSIEVKINRNENFLIAPSVYPKPVDSSWPYRPQYNELSLSNIQYPKVSETDLEYTIFENIGNIKHNLPINVFKVPLRFVAGRDCFKKEVILKIKIFGKNLPKPIEDELKIIVNE